MTWRSLSRALAVTSALAIITPTLALAHPVRRPPSVPTVAAAAAAASTTAPAAPSTVSSGSVGGQSPASLSRSDLIALVQPGVVRIVSHFFGTTTVPDFRLDLKTLTWQVDTSTSTPYPYDDYALGSGFIVNSNGYIVTNSHVVSSAEMLTSFASNLAAGIVSYEDYLYPARQTAKLDALSDADYYALIDQGAKLIEQYVSIPSPTVVVLKPGAPLPATSTPVSVIQQNQDLQGSYGLIDGLIKSGVTAQIVSVNNNYLDDEKDVALLKVPETGLPTVHLAAAGSAHEGDQVFVISFPGSGDLNSYSVQPSFTSGTVSALKSSTQHTFDYLQTDADIAPGSSGSPMLNVGGDVVGVTTLSVTSNTGGTAFAFGIPIALVDQMLSANGVTNTTSGDYATYMRKGLALESARHCVAAKKQFSEAERANNAFGGVASFVDPHIQACNALIASGKSIDSWLDYVNSWFTTQSVQFWVLFVLATALILGLGVGVFILMRHMRKDEVLLQELETREAQDEALLHKLQTQETVPASAQSPQQTDPQPTAALPVSPSEIDAPQSEPAVISEHEELTAANETTRAPRAVNLLAQNPPENLLPSAPTEPPQA